MSYHLVFSDVSFAYPKTVDSLFQGLNLDFSPGWTGVVGPNGSGKSTLLYLATGRLVPDLGSISVPRQVVYCSQRTDNPPDKFQEFLSGPDPEAYTIANQLQIGPEWHKEWPRLSHGERKRSQIAVALWRKPDILALDEPTNHIDTEAREMLQMALADYTGIGLLVSHDRELLDSLVSHCVFVERSSIALRAGNYTISHQELIKEREAALSQRDQLDRSLRALDKEVKRCRMEASRSHKLRSKRNLPIKDYDARYKINMARYFGEDGNAGRQMRRLQGRVGQLEKKRDAIAITREPNLGIWIDTEAARKRILYSCDAGHLELGDGRSLSLPYLTIRNNSRIALTGPNGSGKSTLIRSLLANLELPGDHLLYLPQEVSALESTRILNEVRSLDRKDLGKVMRIISCLGSQPDRLLASELPSPGEVRKLMIALGIRRNPWLMIMDEPTNHLDLPSIECLENALKDCPCALLLCSHDKAFLNSLTREEWWISKEAEPVLHINYESG